MDDHDDHRRANQLLWHAWHGGFVRNDIEVWCYQVYSPVISNVVVDISDVAEQKATAVRMWKSQMKIRKFDHYILGLNAFNIRLLPRGRYVEAFFVVPMREYALRQLPTSMIQIRPSTARLTSLRRGRPTLDHHTQRDVTSHKDLLQDAFRQLCAYLARTADQSRLRNAISRCRAHDRASSFRLNTLCWMRHGRFRPAVRSRRETERPRHQHFQRRWSRSAGVCSRAHQFKVADGAFNRRFRRICGSRSEHRRPRVSSGPETDI